MAAESEGRERFLVKGFVIPMKRFPHIQEDQSLREAVKVLRGFTCGEYQRMRYSEMLVINAEHKLIGRVSVQSILRGLDPNLPQEAKGFQGQAGEYPNLAILWGESFFDACSNHFENNIKNFMTSLPKPAKDTDSALTALSTMLSHNETVLPVLSGEAVIGVIRLEEIFNAIVRRCDG